MNCTTRLRTAWIFLAGFLLSSLSIVKAGDLIVSWDPNSESDLLGYKIYYGTSSRNYTTVLDVGIVTSYTVSGLSEGIEYFFAVTAYDTAYNESDFSIEVSAIIEVEDIIPPTVYLVNLLSETELDLTFSEKVEHSSAEDLSNYQICNGININSITLDPNQRVVHIITSPHQPGTYSITVNNVKDLAPVPNTIEPNSSYDYIFQPDDFTPPQIIGAEAMDETHVDVTFSEAINRESAENENNYVINKGIQVLSAILDNSLKIVHLTTSEHQPNTDYTLIVNNVRDGSPNRNPIEPNATFQYYFEVTSGSIVTGLIKDHYQLAYLNIGDEYYVDRNYTITSIPGKMNGYLWIKTANDDRDETSHNFLTFQLREKAKIYVAYDSRAINFPNWLVNDFYRIGKSIGVTEYAQKLDLWEKECDQGVVALGGNLAEGSQGVESMYVVLIESKNFQCPGLLDNMGDPLSLGPANMFLLYQNYPNPFNAGTEIRFQLSQNAFIELTIYNMLGQTVKTLAHGYKAAGHHIFKWEGRNEDGLSVPSGVYFSRLIIKEIKEMDGRNTHRTVYNHVRKMIMVK